MLLRFDFPEDEKLSYLGRLVVLRTIVCAADRFWFHRPRDEHTRPRNARNTFVGSPVSMRLSLHELVPLELDT